MLRSLFLFDMTFWLYLAALGLYVAYVFASRPAMQLVAIASMLVVGFGMVTPPSYSLHATK